jgi:hypothetical protein
MIRSVRITTPIPTLDEVAKDLGSGKARREAIVRIMTSGRAATRSRAKSRRSVSPGDKKIHARNGRGKQTANARASR